MTIKLIENQFPIVLLEINGNRYHWFVWRTLSLTDVCTYEAAEKSGRLGWFTKDGFVSYNQLKKLL